MHSILARPRKYVQIRAIINEEEGLVASEAILRLEEEEEEEDFREVCGAGM